MTDDRRGVPTVLVCAADPVSATTRRGIVARLRAEFGTDSVRTSAELGTTPGPRSDRLVSVSRTRPLVVVVLIGAEGIVPEPTGGLDGRVLGLLSGLGPQEVRVVPVLLDGAPDSAVTLPAPLRDRVREAPVAVRSATLDADVGRLAAVIRAAADAGDTTVVCDSCGHQNDARVSFCLQCGAFLWSSGQASKVAPPPAQPAPSAAARPRARKPGGAPRASSIDDLVQAAVAAAVTPGLLAFHAPDEMRQGRSERVDVRVARSRDLQDALRRGMHGVSPTEPISTSPFMAVELLGKAFDVTPLSTPEQLVAPIARWEFDVCPRRAGTQTLVLSITLRVSLPGRPDERIAVPVFERHIRVRVDPVYGTRRFVRDNWQWLAATGIGLGGALGAWVRVVGG